MQIREYTDYREAEILNLYASVGWAAYTADPEALRRAFRSSMLVLAAYEDERLMGILRAVGDGCTIAYIQDLLVLPDCQRKGVGSALIRELLTRCAHMHQIRLSADLDPDLAAFYAAQGFRPLAELNQVGFQHIRKQS